MTNCDVEPCIDVNPRIFAVILDLDGTLLDTERATKGVFEEFLARYGKEIDKEREKNRRLGMTQIESAAAAVVDYDLPLTSEEFIDQVTPLYREKWAQAKPLPGANRLIRHLWKHGLPVALASNSLSEYIEAKISHHKGWRESFTVILGSDQVKAGKPAPYLFEEAAKRMGVHADNCLVVEDSLVGVEAAKAAKIKVVAVPPRSEAGCHALANVVLHSLLEFQPEIWGLPPFDDWVDNALPIEPIHVNGFYDNGLLSEITGNGKSSLPDQVYGLFFGWANVDKQRSLKAAVSIGREDDSITANRIIHMWVIDGNEDDISSQKMQILLVGYIRGLNNKELISMQSKELAKCKSIATASLDMPLFAQHSDVALESNAQGEDN